MQHPDENMSDIIKTFVLISYEFSTESFNVP